MSTSDKPMETDADTAAEQRPSGRERRRKGAGAPRSGRVSSGLALICSVLALLLTGYLWYMLIYERPELIQLDLPRSLADLERSTGEAKTALDDAEDQINLLTETQNTLKSAIDKIQSELGANQTQWIVSETEQLLLIANRRLQLARDVNSALAALRAADRQLELLASPSLLPVRREIAREISLLEALERTDVAGISLRLGALAEGVDELPVAPSVQAPQGQAAEAQVARANGESAAPSLWSDLLSLVRIRRHENAPRPPLPPEQQYYARENFRLMLYGAQHALLQGNAATYQQNLRAASQWVADYFDGDAPAVAAVQAELDKMSNTPVMRELPDISPSLDMLRKASARRSET